MKINKFNFPYIAFLFLILFPVLTHATSSSGKDAVQDPGIHNPSSDKKYFVDTWKLVSFSKKHADGNIEYPYGKNPIGYLIYTNDNHMSVQIMRQPRQKMSARIDDEYIAYFGRYRIDSDKKIIYHQIEGALALNHLGKNVGRKYSLKGNKLHLSPVEKQTTEIVWERI